MNQPLSPNELADLVTYLARRATIVASYLPGEFDARSPADVVQDVILAYLQNEVTFDPARGASLKTFLAKVMERRLVDHRRRGRKLVSLEAKGRRSSRSGERLAPAADDPERCRRIDIIEKLATEDPEVRLLVNAINDLETIPSNLNHLLGTMLGRPVTWIENLKRRIRYAAEKRRSLKPAKSMLGQPNQEKSTLV
jgi:DNA-directed RNA polymerase specialized sigma24 family protein